MSIPADFPQMIDSSGIPMTFKGWYTSEDFADGTGPYMPGESVPTNDKGLSLYAKWEGPPVLKSGKELNVTLKSLASGTEVTRYLAMDSYVRGIRKSNSAPPGDVETVEIQESGLPVYAWYDSADGYISYYSEAPAIFMNEDSSCMFCAFVYLSDVSGLSGWDAAIVTDMNNMFYRCDYLNVSGLAGWDVGNVKNMTMAFSNCRGLMDISPLERWDTKNVTNMDQAFENCYSLSNLQGLGTWNTENVKSISRMFSNCMTLADLSALSEWNTGNITDMSGLFTESPAIKDISPLAK